MSPVNKKNGKILVSSSPGGLQTGCCFYSCDDCEECVAGETPYKITITMTGLTDCTCQLVDGIYWTMDGVAAAINDIAWILDDDAVWDCFWTGFSDGDFGTLKGWDDAGCTGDPDYIYDLDRMFLEVQRGEEWFGSEKEAVGIVIHAINQANAKWVAVFFYVWTFPSTFPKEATITDCTAVSALANDFVNCGTGYSIPHLYGGTCSIEEGNHG